MMRTITAIALVLFAFCACGGNKSANTTSTTTSTNRATTAPVNPKGMGSGDIAHGKQIFAQNCASCHGGNAQGGMGPNLHGEAARKNLAQAEAWIKNPKPPMPKLYPASLNDKDVVDVATFVESLK